MQASLFQVMKSDIAELRGRCLHFILVPGCVSSTSQTYNVVLCTYIFREPLQQIKNKKLQKNIGSTYFQHYIQYTSVREHFQHLVSPFRICGYEAIASPNSSQRCSYIICQVKEGQFLLPEDILHSSTSCKGRPSGRLLVG